MLTHPQSTVFGISFSSLPATECSGNWRARKRNALRAQRLSLNSLISFSIFSAHFPVSFCESRELKKKRELRTFPLTGPAKQRLLRNHFRGPVRGKSKRRTDVQERIFSSSFLSGPPLKSLTGQRERLKRENTSSLEVYACMLTLRYAPPAAGETTSSWSSSPT